MPKLDRPIFVVGHARGGTTALAAILHWHEDVQPKFSWIPACRDINAFLAAVYGEYGHVDYGQWIEKTTLWSRYFGGSGIFTGVGKEVICEKGLAEDKRDSFLEELTEGVYFGRFLSKSPINSFRVLAIRKMFPDCKIVAIVRRGEQVVSSWGTRTYGFGRPVNWGEAQTAALTYEEGIAIFARKWRETLEYLVEKEREASIYLVTYKQLVTDTAWTVARVLRHCELPMEPWIHEIVLEGCSCKWLEDVPEEYRRELFLATQEGNDIIRGIEAR